MNPFGLQHGRSRELELFPHVREVALDRNNTVQLDAFPPGVSAELRIYYVIDGKFEWIINQKQHTLYPGDVALVLPGSEIGGVNDVLEIGSVFRLFIELDNNPLNEGMTLGEWSGLSGREREAVTNVLMLNNAHLLKIKQVGELLCELESEILKQEIGHVTRVNQLIDALLILIARHSTRQSEEQTDFSSTFKTLEDALRKKLAHQWTVEEMAAMFGLGTTAFTEKIKSHTGFSPMNYLINIRISEAIKLLKSPHASCTDIALETGFYSSQHFSTTFKKLTGYTPGEFRKRNVFNSSGKVSPSVAG